MTILIKTACSFVLQKSVLTNAYNLLKTFDEYRRDDFPADFLFGANPLTENNRYRWFGCWLRDTLGSDDPLNMFVLTMFLEAAIFV